MPRTAPMVRPLPAGFRPERLLRGVGPDEVACWLESADGTGRFSVCGIADREDARVGEGLPPAPREEPLQPLAEAGGADAQECLSEDLPSLVIGLHGGWIGYLGYEGRRHVGHPVSRGATTPDSFWIPARRYAVLDRQGNRGWAVGDAAWCARVLEAAGTGAPEGPRPRHDPDGAPGRADGVVTPVFPAPDREAYLHAVREALGHIRDGNSYEVCLTAESTALVDRPLGLDAALDLYAAQRAANPAPHAAFLWCGDFAVLSSSPERFLSVDPEGWCEAKPIKGTAARSADPVHDAAAAEWLRQDPKSRAENLMIVDLMRNDFSRACTPGTVSVPALMAVESYASVHQLVSTVRGRLAPGRTALDLVAACFPGGSMTGAPKPRTLEIIDALEQRPRGVYSGALGWLGGHGAADLSIVIRTLVLEANGGRTRIRVAAGGAVVADSDPQEEYEEMLTKMRAPLPGSWRVDVPEPSHRVVPEPPAEPSRPPRPLREEEGSRA